MEKTTKKYNVFLIASVFLLGSIVCYLNSTLLTTALPTIMKDLKTTPTTGQWLTTAYMLVNGIMIPACAMLIEKFTTRKLFFIAMGLFTIGTLLGSISTSFNSLLIARILQASGAGIMLPLSQTVFLIIFPKDKRGVAMGVIGIIIAFAPAIGPTLAGLIVDKLPWRYLFHLVIPIAVLDLVLAYFLLKNVTETKEVKIDITSIITSSLGFGGLLYGFSEAGNRGFLSPFVCLPIIIGIFSLVLFTRKQLKSKEPMLNLNVFKSKTFTYSTLVVMIVFTGFVSAELILPMYLQMARGFSALDSGLTLMPGAIIMGVMSPITGKIYDKIGARGLSLLGISLLTIGSFMLSRLTATTSVHEITAIYSLRLFGLSMFMMPITTDGLNSLDNSLIPHGTAINNTLRQVAGSIGSAILVTIMTTVSSNSGIKNPILSEIHGMNESFLVASIFCFIALIIAFFVIKKRPKNELKGNS